MTAKPGLTELEIALRDALALAANELNAIRARDGAPQHVQWGPNGRAFVTDACTHEWWDELTERCFAALALADRVEKERSHARVIEPDPNWKGPRCFSCGEWPENCRCPGELSP